MPSRPAPEVRPLSPPIQTPSAPNPKNPAASGPPPRPLAGRRRTQRKAALPRPDSGPHLPPPAGSRQGGAGPRAATSCGGAGSRGGPARIPPREASRRRDGGGAPGCPRRPGGGEGKRGKSDPSAGSFPRPSLGCRSSLLPTVNAEAASAPASPRPLSVRTQRKAPVLPSAASERRSTSLV